MSPISQVYLDIEGLPGSDSYYLIGALIVSEDQEAFHSFWADQTSEEPRIFAGLAEVVSQLPDYRVFHFGDYEVVALRRIKERLPESARTTIGALMERATNVLSIIHPHVYFPTYSNGLKDIGRFLGSNRAEPEATGLETIVWRNEWKKTGAAEFKTRLLQYNRDDCRTLKHLVEFMRQLTPPRDAGTTQPSTPVKTIQTEQMTKERPRWDIFRPREYASEDFEKIVKCAYFDYQREKVLVRTHPHFKVVNKKNRKFRRTSKRANVVSSMSESGPRWAGPIGETWQITPFTPSTKRDEQVYPMQVGAARWARRRRSNSDPLTRSPAGPGSAPSDAHPPGFPAAACGRPR